MKEVLKKVLLTGALLLPLLTASCAMRSYYAYRVPPPPPPRVMGPVGYAPGPGFVWIDGFWNLRTSRWVWVSGYWTRPPHPRAVWVKPYWEPTGRGYRFHRGYWRR